MSFTHPSDSILTRRSSSSLPPSIHLTPSQARADALVSSFVDHATDGYALAGMVGGGLVYRLGRVGTLALGSRLFSSHLSPVTCHLLRFGSIGIGFTGEVFTFEAGQRALRVGIGGADPNLLRWSGENGLGRGLVGAAITLGSLKGTGAFVNGRNPVLQHLFQDSAMVLAHNVSGTIGITDRPRESLPEQFVNAEATLWQMNAGMALVHGAFPSLGQAERSLDLSVRVHNPPPLRLREGAFFPHIGLSPEGGPSLEPLTAAGPMIVFNQGNGDGGNGGGFSTRPPSPSRRELEYLAPEEHRARTLFLIRQHLPPQQIGEVLASIGIDRNFPLERVILNPMVRGRLLAEAVNRHFREGELPKGLRVWLRIHRLVETAYAHLDFEMVESYLEYLEDQFGAPYHTFLDQMRGVRGGTLFIFDRLRLDQPGRYLVPRTDYLRDVFLRQTDPFAEGNMRRSDRLLENPEEMGMVFAGAYRNDIGVLLLLVSALRRLTPGKGIGDFLRADPQSLSLTAQRYQRDIINTLKGCSEYRRILLEGGRGEFHRNFLRAAFDHPRFGIRHIYPEIYELIRSLPDDLVQHWGIARIPSLEEIDTILGDPSGPPSVQDP